MNTKDLYVVPDPVLQKLRHLRKLRDEQAFIFGQGGIERELRRGELYTLLADKRLPEKEHRERLGNLEHEYLTLQNDVMRRIRASQTDERHLGEQALIHLGLNPRRDELRIDFDNGVVLILENGAWVLMRRAPQLVT